MQAPCTMDPGCQEKRMPHLASGNLSNIKEFCDVGVLQHGRVSEVVLLLLALVCHHEFCRSRIPAPSGFVDLRCTGMHDQTQEGHHLQNLQLPATGAFDWCSELCWGILNYHELGCDCASALQSLPGPGHIMRIGRSGMRVSQQQQR